MDELAKQLLEWADHPASSGMVPIHPTTLRKIAAALPAPGDGLAKQLRDADAALNGTILAKLAHGEGTPEMVNLIVRLKYVAQEAAAALSGVRVPVEINRTKHRHVLDVWNQCMADCDTLEMAWPKLVKAMEAK